MTRTPHRLARQTRTLAVLLTERAADPDTLVLADGFSCRTQIEHATTAKPLHTAEVLAAAFRGRTP